MGIAASRLTWEAVRQHGLYGRNPVVATVRTAEDRHTNVNWVTRMGASPQASHGVVRCVATASASMSGLAPKRTRDLPDRGKLTWKNIAARARCRSRPTYVQACDALPARAALFRITPATFNVLETTRMRKVFFILILGSAVPSVSTMANSKGCLNGAAVGGVGGHVAGHHGLIGAAAGCAIGHHREKVRHKAAVEPSNASSVQDANPMSSGAFEPAK